MVLVNFRIFLENCIVILRMIALTVYSDLKNKYFGCLRFIFYTRFARLVICELLVITIIHFIIIIIIFQMREKDNLLSNL